MDNGTAAFNLKEECIRMQNLDHPNILKSYGFYS
jgi:hypothetical protein